MRLRAIALAGVLAAMATAVPVRAATLPKLLEEDFATSFAVAPTWIVVSGDGSAIIAGNAAWIGRNPSPNKAGSQFGHVTWSSWTATRASGSGVFWLNNCTPNCAQGTYFPATVRIVASQPKGGHFTRLALSGSKTADYKLEHVANGYVWNV